MAIVKMKKLSLGVMDDLREKVFVDLQKIGIVHIDEVEEVEEQLSFIDFESDEIDEYIDALDDVICFLENNRPPIKLGLLDSLGATLPELSVVEMRRTYERFQLDPVLKDIRSIEQGYKDVDARLQFLKKEYADLSVWSSVDIDLDLLFGKSETLGAMVGSVSLSQKEQFFEVVAGISEYIEAIPVHMTGGEIYIYLVFLKSEENKIYEAIKSLGFAVFNLPHRKGLISEAMEEINEEIIRLSSRQELYRMMIVDYIDYIDTLKVIHDYLLIQQDRVKTLRQGSKTQSVSFYTGWVPEPDIESLKNILDRYDELDYTLSDPLPEEYENVPVELDVPKAAMPFKPITQMFGLPVYGKTIDPTAHLTPFYFLFYGFCLGDFMYGFIMFVLFGFLARKSRNNPDNYYFMKMFSLAGLSSMIFGFIFGSFFGNLFTNPDYLYIPFMVHVGFINALKKPMVVLYIALIFGAVQLIYGVLLHLLIRARESVSEAIWDDFPWLAFLSGFFGWTVLFWIGGMAKLPLPSAKVSSVLLYIAGSGALMVVINAMRKGAKKGIGGFFGGFFGGLWEIYGATGYFSDLLSYARLLALGLSTSVIASVFNFLAFDMVMKSGGVVAIVLGIVLLVVGHSFNLVLNAFGAFVHALRLQFVEFFSKFMEGGGKEYKPLKEEGLYYQTNKE